MAKMIEVSKNVRVRKDTILNYSVYSEMSGINAIMDKPTTYNWYFRVEYTNGDETTTLIVPVEEIYDGDGDNGEELAKSLLKSFDCEFGLRQFPY